MGKQPNILWIFTDQHRAQAMSCAGDVNIETPNLDRLAAEGIRFENAYTNTPICSPSRACIYLGKYASSHGAYCLHKPPHPNQTMLPEELKALGYTTCHYGKWHISGGAAPSHFVSPYFRPGWDEWKAWENSNRPWATTYAEGDFPLPVLTFEGYQTDVLTDMTLEYLNGRTEDQPWFHVISIEPPHDPHNPPKAYMDLFNNHKFIYRDNVVEGYFDDPKNKEDLIGYYGQIKNIDDNVGRILDRLEATGQLEDTIIMYFSDHGDSFGSHGLRGKSTPYVESSKIPLLIRYPKVIPKGQVSESLISTVDFLPTILGILGQEKPAYAQGSDLSKVVCGLDEGLDQEVLIQYERSFYGVSRLGQVYRTLVKDRWMYTYYLATKTCHLFDLKEDPYQMNNLAEGSLDEEIKGHIYRMHQRMVEKLDEIDDGFFDRGDHIELDVISS